MYKIQFYIVFSEDSKLYTGRNWCTRLQYVTVPVSGL